MNTVFTTVVDRRELCHLLKNAGCSAIFASAALCLLEARISTGYTPQIALAWVKNVRKEWFHAG